MHFVFVRNTKHVLGAATAVQAGADPVLPEELVGPGMLVRDAESALGLFSIKPENLAVATVEPIAAALARPAAFDVPDDKSPQLRASGTTLTVSGTADKLTITATATVPRGTKMLVQVFNRANGDRQESIVDAPDPGGTVINIPFNLASGLDYDVLALIAGVEPKIDTITVT
jgi:hypothetical protein